MADHFALTGKAADLWQEKCDALLDKSFSDINLANIKKLLSYAFKTPEVFECIKEKAVEIATRKIGDSLSDDIKTRIISQLVPFRRRVQWGRLYNMMIRDTWGVNRWEVPGDTYKLPALSESSTMEFANAVLKHVLSVVETTLSLAFTRDDHSLLPPAASAGWTISNFDGVILVHLRVMHPTASGWEECGQHAQWIDMIPKTL